MNVPSVFTSNVPLASALPPFTSDQFSWALVLSGSLSFPVRPALSVTSSSVLKLSSPATGGSFTGVTSIVTVAVSHAAEGSHT